MNERIQELHEQAMKSCDEHRSDILNYHRIYREKFAELIIKECVSVCMVHRVGNQDYNTGRLHCSFDIKDHFGVKE